MRARSRGLILQIHANEHFPEVHDCILRFRKRPIELLAEHGVLGPHVLIHHATLVTDHEVATQAVHLLREHRPRVLFVHLPGVDLAGHDSGWGSNQQVTAVAHCDAAIGLVLNQRQSPLVFAKVIVLAMPQLIVLILPVAVLVAGLTAINRLHRDNEIVICFSSGVGSVVSATDTQRSAQREASARRDIRRHPCRV